MADSDEEYDGAYPVDPDTQDFEYNRKASFRTFTVTLMSGIQVVGIVAHFWSADPSGCLNFFTIEPSGRQAISNAFGARAWQSLYETTAPHVKKEIDELARQDRERHKRRAAGMRTIAPRFIHPGTGTVH